jgi:hypothetical protein
VKPQPVWRLRTSRVAATASLAVMTIALVVGVSLAADWLTPYRDVLKAAKPLSSRIHFGVNDTETTSPVVSKPRPAPARPAAHSTAASSSP